MPLTRVSKRSSFLAAYAELGNITRAAQAAGIPRTKHYTWLKDPAYAKSFLEAEEIAIERLESEARRRAVEGTEKPVFYKGEECGTIREYSDTLLIFLLNAARPEKYKKLNRHEIVGANGGPVEVHHKYDKLSDEELDKLIEDKILEIGKVGLTDPT